MNTTILPLLTTLNAILNSTDFNITNVTTAAQNVTTVAPTLDPVEEFFRPWREWFSDIHNPLYYLVFPIGGLIFIGSPIIYIVGHIITYCRIYVRRRKKGLPMKWPKKKTILQRLQERKQKREEAVRQVILNEKRKEAEKEWLRLYGNNSYHMTIEERLAYLEKYVPGFRQPTKEEIAEMHRKEFEKEMERMPSPPPKPKKKKKNISPSKESVASFNSLHSPVPDDLNETFKDNAAVVTIEDEIMPNGKRLSRADIKLIDEEIQVMKEEEMLLKQESVEVPVEKENEITDGVQPEQHKAPEEAPAAGGMALAAFKLGKKKKKKKEPEPDSQEADKQEDKVEGEVNKEEVKPAASLALAAFGGKKENKAFALLAGKSGGEGKPKLGGLGLKFAALANTVRVQQAPKAETYNQKWKRMRATDNAEEKKKMQEEIKKQEREMEAETIKEKQEKELQKRWDLQFNYFALLKNAVEGVKNQNNRAEDDFVPANLRSIVVPEKCYKMSKCQKKAKDGRYRYIAKHYDREEQILNESSIIDGTEHVSDVPVMLQGMTLKVKTDKHVKPIELPTACFTYSRYNKLRQEKRYSRHTSIQLTPEEEAKIDERLAVITQAIEENSKNEIKAESTEMEKGTKSNGHVIIPMPDDNDAYQDAVPGEPLEVPPEALLPSKAEKTHLELKNTKPINVNQDDNKTTDDKNSADESKATESFQENENISEKNSGDKENNASASATTDDIEQTGDVKEEDKPKEKNVEGENDSSNEDNDQNKMNNSDGSNGGSDDQNAQQTGNVDEHNKVDTEASQPNANESIV